jgi:hypothetical protein
MDASTGLAAGTYFVYYQMINGFTHAQGVTMPEVIIADTLPNLNNAIEATLKPLKLPILIVRNQSLLMIHRSELLGMVDP